MKVFAAHELVLGEFSANEFSTLLSKIYVTIEVRASIYFIPSCPLEQFQHIAAMFWNSKETYDL